MYVLVEGAAAVVSLFLLMVGLILLSLSILIVGWLLLPSYVRVLRWWGGSGSQENGCVHRTPCSAAIPTDAKQSDIRGLAPIPHRSVDEARRGLVVDSRSGGLSSRRC